MSDELVEDELLSDGKLCPRLSTHCVPLKFNGSDIELKVKVPVKGTCMPCEDEELLEVEGMPPDEEEFLEVKLPEEIELDDEELVSPVSPRRTTWIPLKSVKLCPAEAIDMLKGCKESGSTRRFSNPSLSSR